MSTSVLKEKSGVEDAKIVLQRCFEGPSLLRVIERAKEDEVTTLAKIHKHAWSLVAGELGIDRSAPFLWDPGTRVDWVLNKLMKEFDMPWYDSVPPPEVLNNPHTYNTLSYFKSGRLFMSGIIPPSKNLFAPEKIVGYISSLFGTGLLMSDSIWLNVLNANPSTLFGNPVNEIVAQELNAVTSAYTYRFVSQFGYKLPKSMERYLKSVPEYKTIKANPIAWVTRHEAQLPSISGQITDEAERQYFIDEFTKVLKERSAFLEGNVELLVKVDDSGHGHWDSITFPPQN